MNEDLEVFKQTMSGRAAVYEYLSLVFKEPPTKSFIGLSGKFVPVFAGLAENFNSENLKRGTEYLREYDKQESGEGESLLGNLNSQYTSLFLLGFSSVPTTASALLIPGGVMKQEPWEKVMQIYSRWGYKLPSDFKEPEDHIYAELRFMEKMAVLAVKLAENGEIDKVSEAVKTQHAFLKDNMHKWIEEFCSLVIKRSKISQHKYKLYLGASFLTAGFIEEDIKLL